MKKLISFILSSALILSLFGGMSALATETLSGGFVVDGTTLVRYEGSGGDVVIPEGIVRISSLAFSWNFYIVSVSIPDSVTLIDEGPFTGCTLLSEINVSPGNSAYLSQNGVLFNKNKTALIRYPQGKAGNTYSIPDGVMSICSCAFLACIALDSITIPDSVTSIDEEAFESCSSLEAINIPDGVTAIANYAFCDCSALVSVNIPAGVSTIGYMAFGFCDSLVSVSIPDNVTAIADGAFSLDTTLTVTYDSYGHQWATDNNHPYVFALISSFDNIHDVFYLLKIIVSNIPISEEQTAIADVNEDGAVNSSDALIILKQVLNLTTT